MRRTKKITLSAMMVAVAIVLTLLSKLLPAPWLQGGSITFASAVPIILLSLILGWKWGVLAAIAFSIIQMITGFYPPPVKNVWYFALVVLLDYVVAFGVYGTADIFCKMLRRKSFAIPFSGFIVMTIRYICHIITGVFIWGVYAPEGQPVWEYSIIYNGLYMVPEIIITTAVLALFVPFVKRYGE